MVKMCHVPLVEVPQTVVYDPTATTWDLPFRIGRKEEQKMHKAYFQPK